MKRRLGEALNIHISNDINKYLECPIIQGKVKMSVFHEVILKFQKKLASLKTCLFSRASKITLIKDNLTSSSLHAMNCFKLKKNE